MANLDIIAGSAPAFHSIASHFHREKKAFYGSVQKSVCVVSDHNMTITYCIPLNCRGEHFHVLTMFNYLAINVFELTKNEHVVSTNDHYVCE